MRYVILLGLLMLLGACANNNDGSSAAGIKQDTTFLPINYDYKKLEGIYSGDFGGSDIHISLRHVNGRHAMGYSLHKGLKRNFSGSMKQEGNGFRFKLSEPGNNQYDGVFEFFVDTVSFGAKGSWVPNDTRTLTTKNYLLVKAIDSQEEYTPNYTDSIGGLIFEKDGLCTYEVYHEGGEDHQAPKASAKGNWIKKGDVFIIDWEPNSIFQSRRMNLKLEKQYIGDTSEGIYNQYLPLEGRKLFSDGLAG